MDLVFSLFLSFHLMLWIMDWGWLEILVKLHVSQRIVCCPRNPRTIGPDAMAVEAMKKMESSPSPVQFLPVIKDDNILIGIVTLHGLVSAGLW